MKEIEKTSYFISFAGCGTVWQEVESYNGKMVCPICGKIMRIIVKRGKIVMMDVNEDENSPLFTSWIRLSRSGKELR